MRMPFVEQVVTRTEEVFMHALSWFDSMCFCLIECLIVSMVCVSSVPVGVLVGLLENK